MHMAPLRLLLLFPIFQGAQAEVQQPLRLSLLLRDEAHDILVQSDGYDFGMYVSGEAELIFLLGHLTHKVIALFCHIDYLSTPHTLRASGVR